MPCNVSNSWDAWRAKNHSFLRPIRKCKYILQIIPQYVYYHDNVVTWRATTDRKLSIDEPYNEDDLYRTTEIESTEICVENERVMQSRTVQ